MNLHEKISGFVAFEIWSVRYKYLFDLLLEMFAMLPSSWGLEGILQFSSREPLALSILCCSAPPQTGLLNANQKPLLVWLLYRELS